MPRGLPGVLRPQGGPHNGTGFHAIMATRGFRARRRPGRPGICTAACAPPSFQASSAEENNEGIEFGAQIYFFLVLRARRLLQRCWTPVTWSSRGPSSAPWAFRQPDTPVPAGTEGTVLAVSPGSRAVDIQFKGVPFPQTVFHVGPGEPCSRLVGKNSRKTSLVSKRPPSSSTP